MMGPRVAETASNPGRIQRLRHRLLATRPSARELFILAPIWGALMALSALTALYLRNGAETSHIYGILALYFRGGLFAWPIAIVISNACALGRAAETRFAAYFLALTLCTIALTAVLFALHYRSFYARWHAPPGTRIWFYQFAFTSAGAIYQFVVMGVRLFLPVGFLCLGAASLWLAWRSRAR